MALRDCVRAVLVAACAGCGPDAALLLGEPVPDGELEAEATAASTPTVPLRSATLARLGLAGGNTLAQNLYTQFRPGMYYTWGTRGSLDPQVDFFPLLGSTRIFDQPGECDVVGADFKARHGAEGPFKEVPILMGNELPQDTMGTPPLAITPDGYARAFHDWKQCLDKYQTAHWRPALYFGAAVYPTQPMGAGTFLDFISQTLARYQALYGAPMPVAGFHMHLYFKDVRTELLAMRQRMKDVGLRDRPLYITELGQLSPRAGADVRAYLRDSLTHLATARSDTLGYPRDENRLVQGTTWYVYSADYWHPFNGHPDHHTRFLCRSADGLIDYGKAVTIEAPSVQLQAGQAVNFYLSTTGDFPSCNTTRYDAAVRYNDGAHESFDAASGFSTQQVEHRAGTWNYTVLSGPTRRFYPLQWDAQGFYRAPGSMNETYACATGQCPLVSWRKAGTFLLAHPGRGPSHDNRVEHPAPAQDSHGTTVLRFFAPRAGRVRIDGQASNYTPWTSSCPTVPPVFARVTVSDPDGANERTVWGDGSLPVDPLAPFHPASRHVNSAGNRLRGVLPEDRCDKGGRITALGWEYEGLLRTLHASSTDASGPVLGPNDSFEKSPPGAALADVAGWSAVGSPTAAVAQGDVGHGLQALEVSATKNQGVQRTFWGSGAHLPNTLVQVRLRLKVTAGAARIRVFTRVSEASGARDLLRLERRVEATSAWETVTASFLSGSAAGVVHDRVVVTGGEASNLFRVDGLELDHDSSSHPLADFEGLDPRGALARGPNAQGLLLSGPSAGGGANAFTVRSDGDSTDSYADYVFRFTPRDWSRFSQLSVQYAAQTDGPGQVGFEAFLRQAGATPTWISLGTATGLGPRTHGFSFPADKERTRVDELRLRVRESHFGGVGRRVSQTLRLLDFALWQPLNASQELDRTWRVDVQLACPSGRRLVPQGQLQATWALWPPTPLSWSTTPRSSTGRLTFEVRGQHVWNNLYVVGQTQNGWGENLVPSPAQAAVGITSGTYFNPPTPMYKLAGVEVEPGPVALRYQAPSSWCVP